MNGAVHHDGRRGTAARRDELLEAATDYVLAHGLASLSIRPLASALGLSHRTLLYYFESKEQLVLAVLELIRERDKVRIREYLGRVPLSSGIDLFRAAWGYFSAPERTEYVRFFHEVFTMGLHGPPYRAWAETIVHGRNDMIAAALTSMGVPAARARAGAVLITAAVRGLQLHLLTTGDRAITDAAFEELLLALDARLSTT